MVQVSLCGLRRLPWVDTFSRCILPPFHRAKFISFLWYQNITLFSFCLPFEYNTCIIFLEVSCHFFIVVNGGGVGWGLKMCIINPLPITSKSSVLITLRMEPLGNSGKRGKCLGPAFFFYLFLRCSLYFQKQNSFYCHIFCSIEPLENIAGNGENFGNKHFLFFPQCFL